MTSNIFSAVRLTSFICGALTELDIRDNESLYELDLSNLPTIQVFLQIFASVSDFRVG